MMTGWLNYAKDLFANVKLDNFSQIKNLWTGQYITLCWIILKNNPASAQNIAVSGQDFHLWWVCEMFIISRGVMVRGVPVDDLGYTSRTVTLLSNRVTDKLCI